MQVHVRPKRRMYAVALLLSLAIVVPAGVPLSGGGLTPAAATPFAAEEGPTNDSGYDYTLRVNDVRLIPDATPGDASCGIAETYGAGCTLLAAAQEANALSAAHPDAHVLVTLATPTLDGAIRQLDGKFANTGTILLKSSPENTPTGFQGMIRGSTAMKSIVGGAVDGDTAGSIFWFAGSVVVDLQNRFSIIPPGDGGMSGVVMSFTGQDQVLRNFSNIAGADGVIYAGKTAKNLLIERGKVANGPNDSGGLAIAAERGISVVAGATATQLRGVTIDSMWRGGITIVPNAGSASEAVHGLSVVDSTISWDNRHTGNVAYGIGKWEDSVTRVDDLVVVGSTFKDFRRGTSYDNNVPISGDFIQFGGLTRISGNRFVNTLDGSVVFDAANNDIRLTQAPLAGATVSIERNVFSNETAWSPNGAAVVVAGGVAASGTVSVTDNAFYGWNLRTAGEVISVSSSGGPSVALDRNTFSNVGGYTSSANNAAELPGDTANPVYVSNANANVRTAYPSAAVTIPDACQVAVTVQRPQAGGSQPNYPVRVDAFAGGANGADVYLGRALVADEADWGTDGAKLTYPFALGGGKLRLQTIDALGNTSPLSRTVDVEGATACGPQLWIRQAETQEDPSWSRFLEYEVMSSVPLADGALESALVLSGSSAAAEIVRVSPASVDASANTRWKVMVRANASGTVVLGAAAGGVRDRLGNSNALSANATDAPNNVVRSADPAGIAGTPGAQFDSSVEYRLPVVLSDTVNGNVPAVEGSMDNGLFGVSFDASDALGRPTHVPVSTVSLEPRWSNLVPDASMPNPESSADAQVSVVPNHPSTQANAATLDSSARKSLISVAAVNNAVVDGTRAVTLTPTMVSDDPEYDGIVLDPFTVTVFDDDAPAAAKSSTEVTRNNQTADGTSANEIRATIRNSAGVPVQNAVVHAAVPTKLTALGDGDPVPGPTSVSGITDEQGNVVLKFGSTVARASFDVAVSVDSSAQTYPVDGSPVAVQFVPGAASAAHSALSVTPGKLAVDGEPHTARVLVVDAYGNPVGGQAVTFAADALVTVSNGGVAISDEEGIARVTLKSERAQTMSVSAAIGVAEAVNSPTTVDFGAGSYSAEQSGVEASESVAEANGEHEVMLQARLKDRFGNLIVDELADVNILAPSAEVSATIYQGDGVYSARMTSTQEGSVRASVSVGGVVASGSADVQFAPTPKTPRPDPSNGSKVSGWAEPAMTVTVRDADGTLLATTTADILGRFSTLLSVPVIHDQRLTVQARDANGFVSAGSVLTIDLVAPDAPRTEPSNGWALKICPEANSSVRVQDKSGRVIEGDLGEVTQGCVKFSPRARLTESVGVQVYAEDAAGNVSAPFTPFIKTTLPVVPETEPSNGVTIYGGTVEPTDRIQFLDGRGVPLRGAVAIDERGQFTFTPTTRAQTGDTVVMRVTDPVGNSAEATVPISSTPPVPAVVAEFTSKMVSGYAEPGSTVTVTDERGALLGTATAGPDGYFEIALLLVPTRNEVIALLVTDELGNESGELKLRLSGASILIERPVLANEEQQAVHGFGYVPGERVVAQLDASNEALGVGVVDENGSVSLDVRLSSSVALGDHTILLAGEKTTMRSESFKVAERSTLPLAATGGDPSVGTPRILMASLFIALGLTVLILGLRRRPVRRSLRF